MKKCLVGLLVLFCVPILFAGTLNVYNHWKDKDAQKIYLYMSYRPKETSNVKFQGELMNNKTYYPLSDDITDTKPAVISWDTINSGNVSFCTFTGPVNTTDPQPAWNAAGNDNLSGFIEFSQIKATDVITCDLSNVDAVGLICGLSGLPTKQASNEGKAGYKLTQTALVDDMIKNYSCPDGAVIFVAFKDKTYSKVVAPGKSDITPDPWVAVFGTYYNSIQAKNMTLDLKVADNSGVHWTGNQYAVGAKFPDIIYPKSNKLSGTEVPIAVHLKTTYQIDNQSYNWDLYLAKEKWNAETINLSDSDGGLYIQTDYPLPNTAPGYYENKTTKVYGVRNQHINWQVISGGVKQPKYVQNVAALFRDLMVGFQLGLIDGSSNSITSPSKVKPYTYGGNLYNKCIMKNSDSYGNPYSDNSAAGGKVLYNPVDSFSLHIFGPNDSDIGNYYSTPPAPPAGPGKYLIGIPAALGTATVNGEPYDPNGFNSSVANIVFSKYPESTLEANFTTETIDNKSEWNYAAGCDFSIVPNPTKQHQLAIPANLSPNQASENSSEGNL